MQYTAEIRAEAQSLYAAGEEVTTIADKLAINLRTLYNWIKQGRWDDTINRATPLAVIERRICLLTQRETKTVMEIFELERLIIQYEKLKKLAIQLKVKQESQQKTSSSSNDSTSQPTPKKRGRKPNKNDFTEWDEEYITDYLAQNLFDYQLDLWQHRDERTRNILKSRQIGATFYFAKEAFCDALLTGKNKIFLSASRAQADVFREYIKFFALEGFETELKGSDKIELTTKHGTAILYFLSTNSSTAQSYHGDVYIDEYFWIPNFAKLNKVASAMASQKKWCKTYFSTPSTASHQAYPYWSGDEFNERNKRINKPLAEFPSQKELQKNGIRCADGTWRRVITLEDAERGGCNLFDIEQLKLEYSEEEFNQLFMCHFIDDSGSVFSYNELQKCIGDEANFPSGLYNSPVWIGFDPSRTRDDSSIIILSCPQKYKGKMYVLEKVTLKDTPWPAQAEYLKGLTQKYNVSGMSIDCTGAGSGVFEFVRLFYPRAKGVFYTTDEKKLMVLKAQQVINDKRVAWDAKYSDIAAGFLQIKRGISKDSNLRYYADRTMKGGHADSAWALMHALSLEEFILPETERTSTYD